MLHERQQVNVTEFVELKIWQVPRRVKGSEHQYKYSPAYVVEGECVLRYDNEAGKGDHKHSGDTELDCTFTSPEKLLGDVWHDVD